MKGLELNGIIVVDLLELVLIISAEDMNCQGQGIFPGGGDEEVPSDM